jgi:hypothetical protein
MTQQSAGHAVAKNHSVWVIAAAVARHYVLDELEPGLTDDLY